MWQCCSRVASGLALNCSNRSTCKAAPLTFGRPGMALGKTWPRSRRALRYRLIVAVEMANVSATSTWVFPWSMARSTRRRKSWEYAFMQPVYHRSILLYTALVCHLTRLLVSFSIRFTYLNRIGVSVIGSMLSCLRYKASFNRPTTFWAKIYTLREVKITIHASCSDSCSPLLDVSIKENHNFNWSATFWAEICAMREPHATMQAPFNDSCSHLLFLFYRPGFYPFSTATFKKT